MGWDGLDRRGSRDSSCNDCSPSEIQSRIRALEVYRENHSEKLDRLTKAVETNNDHLSKLSNILTEIKTTQRNTHAFAGIVGAVLGSAAEFFGHKIVGG